MGSFGPLEIFLIFLVILLVFGAKRIPEIARGLGKGISEFKKATQEFTSEFDVSDQPSQIDRSKRPSKGDRAPRSSPNYQRQPSQHDGSPGGTRQTDAETPQGQKTAENTASESSEEAPQGDSGSQEEAAPSPEKQEQG